ncbi:MAG: hypothetical protein JSV26_03515 [bacterium]|nr:MAG: hypothetical protein JSV26_03515 [bacterium]
MTNSNDLNRERLRKEADAWIEKELKVRMEHAKREIENQAEISSLVCGDDGARRHVEDATAYAEEELRKQLEHEAREWVEKEMVKGPDLKYGEHILEPTNC